MVAATAAVATNSGDNGSGVMAVTAEKALLVTRLHQKGNGKDKVGAAAAAMAATVEGGGNDSCSKYQHQDNLKITVRHNHKTIDMSR